MELFCGSARVTACLKAFGVCQAFGVDHVNRATTAPVRILDLSKQKDQRTLMRWLQSPLCAGIFAAPPCGTCSKARNIPLVQGVRKGNFCKLPRPLRSDQFPEGLPGLTTLERIKVSQANKLFDFLATVILNCLEREQIVAVENPRGSFFWKTRFWKTVSQHFRYQAHQACGYGSSRPKWTVIAYNHSAFAKISRTCPGESRAHVHEPWGLVQHGPAQGNFATALETAYPPALALHIAIAFVEAMKHRGWSPGYTPYEPHQLIENSVLLRSITGHQPRASKAPALVPEFASCLMVRSRHPIPAPCPIMTKLTKPWAVPPFAQCALPEVPIHSKLLRATPIRLIGGDGDDYEKDKMLYVFELAWGVPHEPEKFVQEAVTAGHPSQYESFLPKILHQALEAHKALSDAELVKLRLKWVKKWTERSQTLELRASERDLKASLPQHAKTILKDKKIALWKEMLEDLQYEDMGVVDELVEGTKLLGEVPLTNVFPQHFKPAEFSVEDAKQESQTLREVVLKKTRSSGDRDLDAEVFEKTIEEVSKGWLAGPMELSSLPEPSLIGRRFGLKQGPKTRLIDDLTVGGQNGTVQSNESPKPQGPDVIAAILIGLMKVLPGESVEGRAYDLKSAYKQLAICESDLWAAFVSCFNPKTKSPSIFQLKAVPFGATRAVYSFLRVVRSIWYIGVVGLKLPWSCFFDDFVVFSKQGMVKSTDAAVTALFRLIGWKFAEEGEKCQQFSSEVSALGIKVCLKDFSRGKVYFDNTEKRKQDLSDLIQETLKSKNVTQKEGQVLRGKLQFADSQVYGRLSKLCLAEVSKLCASGGKALDGQAEMALKRFLGFLSSGKPRVLSCHTDRPFFLFTDACFEPTSPFWACGLGGVLVNDQGILLEFFSCSLSDEEMKKLGSESKKSIIFEAELLALIVAMYRWSSVLKSASCVCYIDNNAVRDVAISGRARNAAGIHLLERLLQVEMRLGVNAWFCRVASESNIADYPSRNDLRLFNAVRQVEVKPLIRQILKGFG